MAATVIASTLVRITGSGAILKSGEWLPLAGSIESPRETDPEVEAGNTVD
jgi:hypothetical protein